MTKKWDEEKARKQLQHQQKFNPERFKDHKVTVYHQFQLPPYMHCEYLRFQKPGHGVLSIAFFRKRGLLMVDGDWTEAVYNWYTDEKLDLQWMSQTDFGYFRSKCRASENGREARQWSGDTLKIRAIDQLRDYNPELEKQFLQDIESDYFGDPLYSNHEWVTWLQQPRETCDHCNGTYYFGELTEAPMGWIPFFNIRIHHGCLGLAMKHLKEHGVHDENR